MAFGLCTPGIAVCRVGADAGRLIADGGRLIEKASQRGETYCEEQKAKLLDKVEIEREEKSLETLEEAINAEIALLENTRQNLGAAKASAPLLEEREAMAKAKIEVLEKRRIQMANDLDAHKEAHAAGAPVEETQVETVPQVVPTH